MDLYLYTDPESGQEHRINFPADGLWSCDCGAAENKTSACKAVYSVIGAYEWFPRSFRGQTYLIKGYQVYGPDKRFPLGDLTATAEGHIFDTDGDS